MLLYVVVTIFQLLGVSDEVPPIAIYRGTALLSEAKCEKAAAELELSARKLILKSRVPLKVSTFCDRSGVAL